MAWLSRLWRRKVERTGTLLGNHSALDDVLENEPPLLSQDRNLRGLYRAQAAEAVNADIGRDLSSAFDDLEEAHRRRLDALREPEDDAK